MEDRTEKNKGETKKVVLPSLLIGSDSMSAPGRSVRVFSGPLVRRPLISLDLDCSGFIRRLPIKSTLYKVHRQLGAYGRTTFGTISIANEAQAR
ncbi:Hypp1565 [Branchiostoma lanceolatum]|uniref:Hypp1565 protein n=1 Tax=Branchiostoma lanceolatum TaxID=7740 RepID=A0A8J9ZJ00_BRALA|nr:Hypp1565 [Branchiostoma lanceolatum]